MMHARCLVYFVEMLSHCCGVIFKSAKMVMIVVNTSMTRPLPNYCDVTSLIITLLNPSKTLSLECELV